MASIDRDELEQLERDFRSLVGLKLDWLSIFGKLARIPYEPLRLFLRKHGAVR